MSTLFAQGASLDALTTPRSKCDGILDAHLRHPVGLALVALRMLLADGLKVLHVDLHLDDRLGEYLLDGKLVVSFQDDLRVAHPRQVVADQLGDMAVFAHALHRDNVDVRQLGVGAPDDDVLHDLALCAGLDESILVSGSYVCHGLGLLVAHALRSVEEVVHANDCDLLLSCISDMSTLFAEGASLDTLTTPRPKRDVRDTVLFDIGGAGLLR